MNEDSLSRNYLSGPLSPHVAENELKSDCAKANLVLHSTSGKLLVSNSEESREERFCPASNLLDMNNGDASNLTSTVEEPKEMGIKPEKRQKNKVIGSPLEHDRIFNELSNSSWSETSPWVIGTNYHLFPLTPGVQQRIIFQYLTPLGEYQEVCFAFTLHT